MTDFSEATKLAQKTIMAYNQSGGPTPTIIHAQEVQLMAMIMCSIPEMAAYYNITERHFYRRLAQQPELRDAFDRGRAMGKRMLRRKQFEIAMSGDGPMLRWLGQNGLGQSNRHVMVADSLDRTQLDDAIDAEFEEIFEQIDAELEEHGILDTGGEAGDVVSGAGAGQGPGKDAPASSEESLS